MDPFERYTTSPLPTSSAPPVNSRRPMDPPAAAPVNKRVSPFDSGAREAPSFLFAPARLPTAPSRMFPPQSSPFMPTLSTSPSALLLRSRPTLFAASNTRPNLSSMFIPEDEMSSPPTSIPTLVTREYSFGSTDLKERDESAYTQEVGDWEVDMPTNDPSTENRRVVNPIYAYIRSESPSRYSPSPPARDSSSDDRAKDQFNKLPEEYKDNDAFPLHSTIDYHDAFTSASSDAKTVWSPSLDLDASPEEEVGVACSFVNEVEEEAEQDAEKPSFLSQDMQSLEYPTHLPTTLTLDTYGPLLAEDLTGACAGADEMELFTDVDAAQSSLEIDAQHYSQKKEGETGDFTTTTIENTDESVSAQEECDVIVGDVGEEVEEILFDEDAKTDLSSSRHNSTSPDVTEPDITLEMDKTEENRNLPSFPEPNVLSPSPSSSPPQIFSSSPPSSSRPASPACDDETGGLATAVDLNEQDLYDLDEENAMDLGISRASSPLPPSSSPAPSPLGMEAYLSTPAPSSPLVGPSPSLQVSHADLENFQLDLPSENEEPSVIGVKRKRAPRSHLRPTLSHQKRQRDKLTIPFRSPLVAHMDGLPSGVDRGVPRRGRRMKIEDISSPAPEQMNVVATSSTNTIDRFGGATSSTVNHRTARASLQFQSPFASASLPSMRPTPQLQALERKVQNLKRVLKIRNDEEDEELVDLENKWKEVGREVALELWGLVGDTIRNSAGEGDAEMDQSEGVKIVVEVEDEEGGKGTMGMLLAQCGVAPQVLGWDEGEGRFVDV